MVWVEACFRTTTHHRRCAQPQHPVVILMSDRPFRRSVEERDPFSVATDSLCKRYAAAYERTGERSCKLINVLVSQRIELWINELATRYRSERYVEYGVEIYVSECTHPWSVGTATELRTQSANEVR